MPRPLAGESTQHFVSRYVASHHGKERPMQQKLAIAYSMARKSHLKMAKQHKKIGAAGKH